MYLYLVAYDGTIFHGFTGHPQSVDRHLARALGPLRGYGSRTDPGVSAVGNAVAAERWVHPGALRLPRGIWVWGYREVPPDFNPRRARSREYLYVAPHMGEDLEAMREAASLFVGTHDFSSFMRRRGEPQSPVTTVHSVEVWQEGPNVLMRFRGRGFRNKMIRKMAWAILAAGRGAMSAQAIRHLLESPRPGAVPSAPAEGLVLLSIDYGLDFQVHGPALAAAARHLLWRARQWAALAAACGRAAEALLGRWGIP